LELTGNAEGAAPIREEPTMNRMARFATTVAVFGGLALTGSAIGGGTAQADPGAEPEYQWCPGQALPDRSIRWDMGVCHT
jgi:hypothetical protein